MRRVANKLVGLLIVVIVVSCGGARLETASNEQETSTEKSSIVEKMKAYEALSLDEKISLYKDLKRDSLAYYHFESEKELTLYGYSFLWENNISDAIKVFNLINSEFNSSNSYDNLGEAYQKLGDTANSIPNYLKSVEMDPNNFNAEDQIELMRYPNKVAEKPSDKFAKVYAVEQYREDLDQLGNKLLTVHPNALKFITKANFTQLIEEKKALISEQTTYAEFVWHCSEIIASVNCSHTSIGGFYKQANMLPFSMSFPLQARLVNHQLFVVDPKNNKDQVKVKDEIMSINGVLVADLISDIYRHISSQGYNNTSKNKSFNVWAAAMIPYALHFPESFKIQVKGNTNLITLNKAETFIDIVKDPTIKNCDKELCLELLDKKTAVLSISSFNYYPFDRLPVFIDFIDSSMKVINEKKIENLVIDVRMNGGGSSQSSVYLLRYLMNEPFTYYATADFKEKTGTIPEELPVSPFENRFKGKQYFIIDGNGNSTTGHFMSLVKVHQLGPIVGEELGSNQFCSGGQNLYRLSNTKLKLYIATNTHVSTATTLPDEVGILPDYSVSQSIDEYIKQKDAVKEYTLNLIK